jgi:hypothetical protein
MRPLFLSTPPIVDIAIIGNNIDSQYQFLKSGATFSHC